MRGKPHPDEPALTVTQHEERDIGWVFYYQSTRYVESGDPVHMVLGNAPILIDRASGLPHLLGTARGVDTNLADYKAGRHACELCSN
ncbi:hypothetical protein Cme02nite_34970 [Catellatospora methionotrophica]|uniref:Immunity protein 35 domain-containing protein n=1 Tax=Catellatospora methionotrophica TaxID=121620 RepID=A0A8J3LM43_9ACTN|nr:hypothetical protein Cme02nite_34970 [Catellatospora methionotrophica]